MRAPEVPEWAVKRAVDLIHEEPDTTSRYDARYVRNSNTCLALARYVAAHEEPPFDPLLIEAREMVGRVNQLCRAPVLAGAHDRTPEVQFALAGLRRGIELAQSTEEPKP